MGRSTPTRLLRRVSLLSVSNTRRLDGRFGSEGSVRQVGSGVRVRGTKSRLVDEVVGSNRSTRILLIRPKGCHEPGVSVRICTFSSLPHRSGREPVIVRL